MARLGILKPQALKPLLARPEKYRPSPLFTFTKVQLQSNMALQRSAAPLVWVDCEVCSILHVPLLVRTEKCNH
jgi:hypothetical protein